MKKNQWEFFHRETENWCRCIGIEAIWKNHTAIKCQCLPGSKFVIQRLHNTLKGQFFFPSEGRQETAGNSEIVHFFGEQSPCEMVHGEARNSRKRGRRDAERFRRLVEYILWTIFAGGKEEEQKSKRGEYNKGGGGVRGKTKSRLDFYNFLNFFWILRLETLFWGLHRWSIRDSGDAVGGACGAGDGSGDKDFFNFIFFTFSIFFFIHIFIGETAVFLGSNKKNRAEYRGRKGWKRGKRRRRQTVHSTCCKDGFSFFTNG